MSQDDFFGYFGSPTMPALASYTMDGTTTGPTIDEATYGNLDSIALHASGPWTIHVHAISVTLLAI
jgi:hypothetical protein